MPSTADEDEYYEEEYPLPPPPPLPSYKSNIEECKDEEEVMYDDDDEESSIYLGDDDDDDDDDDYNDHDVERGPAMISRHSNSRHSTQSASSSRRAPVVRRSSSTSSAGAPVVVVKKKKRSSSTTTSSPSIQQSSSSFASTSNHSTSDNNNNNKRSMLKAPSRKVPAGASSSNKDKDENKKKKKNKEFEEFEATGKWGQAPSRNEMYLVGCLAVTILLAVIIVIAVVVAGNNKDADSNGAADGGGGAQEVFPSLSPQEELDLIQAAIAANPVTNQFAGNGTIPLTVEELQGASTTNTEDVETDFLVQAASWTVLQDDEINESNRVLQRFILASLYFATNGQEWNNNDGWLRPDLDVCDGVGGGGDGGGWYGISCVDGQVTEIQLTDNNLQGRIPVTLALLRTLQALWLDSNQLTGDVKGEIFNLDMPDFQFLYLQSNQLTGTIPSNFLDNDSDLRTIYLQGNDFTGSFPDAYCPTCPTCPQPLLQFGLDCKENACPNPWCCNPGTNCFD